MDESTKTLDYYKILECDRTTPLEEIKKNYQRLVLITHPDKLASEEADKFHLIQTAWSVLRDPETRRQYDAELSLKDYSELLLFDSIMLEDMDYDSQEGLYTYNCRCGGTFVLASDSKKNGKMVIGCDECSFALEVTL